MKRNTTFPLGGLALLDKVEEDYGLISSIFGNIGGKSKDFIAIVKFHLNNQVTHSVSVNQMLEVYPEELIKRLGAKSSFSKRSLYRGLDRIGKCFSVVHNQFQQFITEHGLADSHQIIDFSSTYFEGTHAPVAEFGYSRDRRPDKKQLTFGISTGINGIPTALTIQKGNTQDKKHMRVMLKVIPEVIPENSLLIFDTGGNTRANKEKIRELNYHYLTLKAKKVKPYKKQVEFFNENISRVNSFKINDKDYHCVKTEEKGETQYIFFSPELYQNQIEAKERKFLREKEKGNKLLKKRKPATLPSDSGWVTLIPHVQRTLTEITNPYINGIEGFFILESSLDEEPEKILGLYKERDKAEKFFRNLKEGIELRPIRHWSTEAILGIIFIAFLANFIINLTLLERSKPRAHQGKNVKLLKKSLINLTLTVVYPEKGFQFSILSNISRQIMDIFGDFIFKFEDKSLNLRW